MEIDYCKQDGYDMPPEMNDAAIFVEGLREKGYKEQGRIHLPVWRWMCADAQIVESLRLRASEPGRKIRVTVRLGRWRITHTYDIDTSDSLVASELTHLGPVHA